MKVTVMDKDGQLGTAMKYNENEKYGPALFPGGVVTVEYKQYSNYKKQGTYLEPFIDLIFINDDVPLPF